MKQLWSKEEIEDLIKANQPKRYLHYIEGFFENEDMSNTMNIYIEFESSSPNKISETSLKEILIEALKHGMKSILYATGTIENIGDFEISGIGYANIDDNTGSLSLSGVVYYPNAEEDKCRLDSVSISTDYPSNIDVYTITEL